MKINVKGAFIVDQESSNGGSPDGSGVGRGVSLSDGVGIGSAGQATGTVERESGMKDIRLPNHTDVVSHIAVDVS